MSQAMVAMGPQPVMAVNKQTAVATKLRLMEREEARIEQSLA
jgi:hypothetical protein